MSSNWAVTVRDLISRNLEDLPYPDSSMIENQLNYLGSHHFHLGKSRHTYEDGSTKTLIGFSGFIQSGNHIPYAIVGWLTPNFPQTAPDLYLLAKYDETLMVNHRWVKPCGKIEFPYLTQWRSHSSLATLLVELAAQFASWPPLMKRPEKTLSASPDVPGVITDQRLRKVLKQLLSAFPKLQVGLHEGSVSTPVPFVEGYIHFPYHQVMYKIRIQMWLTGFPHQAPEVYVRWDLTNSCIKEDAKYVSHINGAVHTPVLRNWSYHHGFEDYCTLVGVVWNMVDLFSLDPPVRSGVCRPHTSVTSDPNEPKTGGFRLPKLFGRWKSDN